MPARATAAHESQDKQLRRQTRKTKTKTGRRRPCVAHKPADASRAVPHVPRPPPSPRAYSNGPGPDEGGSGGSGGGAATSNS